MPDLRWNMSAWLGCLLVASVAALWQGFWVGLGLWMILYGGLMSGAYLYWRRTQGLSGQSDTSRSVQEEP